MWEKKKKKKRKNKPHLNKVYWGCVCVLIYTFIIIWQDGGCDHVFHCLVVIYLYSISHEPPPRILNESFLLATVSGSIQSLYHHLSHIRGPQAGCSLESCRCMMASLLPPPLPLVFGCWSWEPLSAWQCFHCTEGLPLSLRATQSLPGTSVLSRLCAASLVCWCHHCLDSRLPALPVCNDAAGQNGGHGIKGMQCRFEQPV